ncbi:MAG TPA: alpha/beta hydrolase-fold protein [Polyangiaceae bacterium]|nr:alpha/beta hydrolase-fold protein [Polyangiaceae bacterium]
MPRNEPRLSRRALLAALPAAACGKNDPPERPPAGVVKLAIPSASASAKLERLPAEEQTWAFPDTPIGRMSVVVLVPERLPSDRFPVLITMHGRGETLKGPERGARGWVDDYGLARAITRLAKPPLAERDFEGFVEQSRLAALNTGLGQEPYAGLIVACPYTPDVLGREEPFTQAPLLASFLIDTLLTKIRSEMPAIATPEATGIDGVSLGGRGAIAVGLFRPEEFGAVAGLQAAFDAENTRDFVARAERALEKNPRLRLRLLTSNEDYYLGVMRGFHAALDKRGIRHDFLVVPGPHDYSFNRGPGALEMLVYHDRVLRGRLPL